MQLFASDVSLLGILLVVVLLGALPALIIYFTVRGSSRTREASAFTQQTGLVLIGMMDADPDSLIAIEPAPGAASGRGDPYQDGRLVWRHHGEVELVDAATVLAYSDEQRLTWVLAGTQISGRDQLHWFVSANAASEPGGVERFRSSYRRRLGWLTLAIPVLLVVAAIVYWFAANGRLPHS